MSDLGEYMWLIPGLPLIAAALIAFLGPKLLRGASHWPCIAACAGSCALSVIFFGAILAAGGRSGAVDVHRYYSWFEAGNVDIGIALRMDWLTGIMLVMITFIGSFIALFAVGYMHGDPGYARFFAEISLFIFSMTGLVMADNYVLLYAFWEGVGLCSYLLIGFWFTRPSAAAAARKAFLVTRVGDVGLLLGILLLWSSFGHSFEYRHLFARVSQEAATGSLNHELIVTACLLLFCGAVGKSAQFPLYVWLPDAMEGPTPVSALIHAATMVTAGVYLVARSTPLFAHAPEAQVVVGVIGGITALLAAVIALTQTDLKRVLAYSTISQLGFMFLALGAGSVVAGIYHLFTHAFFKALLFLAAGSVMHAMGNVIDMRRFGGLRKVMPITHATFLCGAASLAALPGFSGFWSKDDIMSGIFAAGGGEHHHAIVYGLLFTVGMLTAAMTAFYTFRAYFMTFWGPTRIPEEAGHHAHESPLVMTIPLIVLAVGAVFVGVLVEPFTHWFTSGLAFLTTGLHHVAEHGPNYLVMGISSVLSVGGLLLAWWMYVRSPGLAGRLADSMRGLYQFSLNKLYVDELYEALLVKPLEGFAVFCKVIDLYVVDTLVDIIGQLPRLFGVLFRPVQNGLVQFYALAMLLGVVVFLIMLAVR